MLSPTSNTICRLQCTDTEACSDCKEHRSLCHKIAALRQKVNARADLLTSTFPVEIVCTIFEAYVNLHFVDTTYESFKSHSFKERPRFFGVVHRSVPLRLGSVCHKWRQLAWSHRTLWTVLFIHLPCPGHQLGAELVNQWLTRARGALVDIRIEDRVVYTRDISFHASMRDSAIQVLQEINKFARIWRGFDFSDLPLSIVEKLDDSSHTDQGCTSFLQSFSFGGTRDAAYGRPTQWILRDSKRKHRPTHLSVMSQFPLARLNMDWSCITTLHMSDMSRRLCFSGILRVLHSPLTHLTLGAIDDYSDDNNMWTPIHRVETLPFLTHLSLRESYISSTTHDIFNHFMLPSLTSLEYLGQPGDHTHPNDFPTDTFLKLVHRSDFRLQSATFLDAVIPDDDLLRVLQGLSTVKTLRLQLRRENDIGQLFERLSQLALRTEIPSFLPALSYLDIASLIPKKWSSLVGMYDDNPSVRGDAPYVSEKAPARKALKLSFRMLFRDRTFQADEYMDTTSIIKLAYLWKIHGVSCTFQIDTERRDADQSDMLDPTFVHQSWCWHAAYKDNPDRHRQEIWDLIGTMSDLHKWQVGLVSIYPIELKNT